MRKAVTLALLLGSSFAHGQFNQDAMAQNFALSMCQGHQQTIGELALMIENQELPPAVYRESFGQIFGDHPDRHVADFLTRATERMMSNPSSWRYYAESGRFVQDCAPLVQAHYHRTQQEMGRQVSEPAAMPQVQQYEYSSGSAATGGSSSKVPGAASRR